MMLITSKSLINGEKAIDLASDIHSVSKLIRFIKRNSQAIMDEEIVGIISKHKFKSWMKNEELKRIIDGNLYRAERHEEIQSMTCSPRLSTEIGRLEPALHRESNTGIRLNGIFYGM